MVLGSSPAHRPLLANLEFVDHLESTAMKVRASVKPICPKCKVIKRKGVVRIICTNARHKQRQG